MKCVCAWCNTVLRDGDAHAVSRPVTHGICLRCAQEFLSDTAEPLREFLDRLGVPVLVVDAGPVVRTANAQARELLGKDLPEIEGHRPGVVIDCVHAGKPGGCGHQLHCQSCTIRRLVLETYATGKSFSRVQATPDLQSTNGIATTRIEISTEKAGGVVLLRLHDVREVDDSGAQKLVSAAEA